jgi:hypothetical protein
MAIHHARDEVATLAAIRHRLRSSGLLCLQERAEPMDVRVADDLGRPGLWDRLAVASAKHFERARTHLPGAMNAERYPDMLAAAGLEVVDSRVLRATVPAPAGAATDDYVRDRLRRAIRRLTGIAATADLEALRAYLAQSPSPARDGATATASRRLFIAASG